MPEQDANLYEEILIAGSGGQGILLAGRLLAQTAMASGKTVTYMPSYGAEVRGGTANCMVVIANEAIASPVVTRPSSAVIMNKASMQKYAARIRENGLVIFNSSLIDEPPKTNSQVDFLAVPADELAVELGNQKTANMVALGSYLQRRGILEIEAAVESIPSVLAGRYANMIELNGRALRRGAEFARKAVPVV